MNLSLLRNFNRPLMQDRLMENPDLEPEIIANEVALYGRLDELSISYQPFHHNQVATVFAARQISAEIAGRHVKNLFLRDKKRNFFLLTAEYDAIIDLKALKTEIKASGNLSFGNPDDLWQMLKVRPGSVNPFSLMFVSPDKIRFFLDKLLVDSEWINAHPMRNDKSLTLKSSDLLKFIASTGHSIEIVQLSF